MKMTHPVFFSKHIPSIKQVFTSAGKNKTQAIVICDKKFRSSSLLQDWRKNKKLHFYYLTSGESAKSFKQLSTHIKKIQSLSTSFNAFHGFFISLGGGSLIDITGFLASIYKRSCAVIHCPTNMLAALDAAHGGKTSCNFDNVKNVLGTYHFPKAVFIIKDFLNQNSKKLQDQARGELLKMALIKGGLLYKKYQTQAYSDMQAYLKLAIQAKMDIVMKDPYELASLRKTLNLGHTIGHVLEVLYNLTHGEAVLQGIHFSLNWSFKKKFINLKYFTEIKKLLPQQKIYKSKSITLFKKYLKQDKKYTKNMQIDFVFIKKPGCVFVKSIKEHHLLQELKRQNLI